MRPLSAFNLANKLERWKARKAGHDIPMQWRVSPTYQCLQCGKSFQSSPSYKRKYCSYRCFLDSGGPIRAGLASKVMVRKYGAKKDANHADIVKALEDGGVSVLDISGLGGGLPDLIVCRRGITLLVEIKNPQTSYGRKGANKLQKAWANGWPAPVYIIRTLSDVEAFVNCREVPTVSAAS